MSFSAETLFYAYENYYKLLMDLYKFNYKKLIYEKKAKSMPTYIPRFEDAIIEFNQSLKNKLPVKKYIIFESKELTDSLKQMDCNITKIYYKIKENFINGDDISPFLRHDKQWAYNDIKLRRWNIHHLHISEPRNNPRKKVKPSDYVLMIKIEDDKAYFLDIIKHPKGDNWFNKNLLEILTNNWPNQLIKLNGVLPQPQGLDGSQLLSIYKKGWNAPVLLNNGDIVLPNIGCSGSGHNIEIINSLIFERKNIFIICNILNGLINKRRYMLPIYLKVFDANNFILIMSCLFDRYPSCVIVSYNNLVNMDDMIKELEYMGILMQIDNYIIKIALNDIRSSIFTANQNIYRIINGYDNVLFKKQD